MSPTVAAPVSALLMTALWLCACAGSPSPDPQQAAAPCSPAGAAFWKQGQELRQYHTDHRGHDVELWCDRGVFNAHWDLRIGWDEFENAPGAVAAARPVHRSRTIAGCFVDWGESVGPDIAEGPDRQYSHIRWTNQDPANDHKKYEFSYDYATGNVTITTTIPGSPPATAVVRPQDNWEQLDALLPNPRGA